jgi:phospholipid transport system substrate-binding protein
MKKKLIMGSLILCCMVLATAIGPAVADVDTEPEKILKISVNKVFSVLSDKKLSLDQKKCEVTEITNSVLAFPLMAKLSIGKEYWSEFNAKQRTEFIRLFTELFHDFYVDKFVIFNNEEVVFQSATEVQEKQVQIQTVLISRGKKYSMLYKMFETKNGWKIYDFDIDGVSMLQLYQSQCHHILKSDKIEGLLTKMKEVSIKELEIKNRHHEINNVFYTVGNSEELRRKKIIDKKGISLLRSLNPFSKNHVLGPDFTLAEFEQEQATLTKFRIDGEITKLLPYRNKNHYDISYENGLSFINIKDSRNFWHHKFLVVVTN